MKKNGLLIILLFSLMAVSCSENSTSGGGSGTGGSGDGGTGFGGGGGSNGGNTGGGSGGASCTTSGTGNGTPIHELRLFLAGPLIKRII